MRPEVRQRGRADAPVPYSCPSKTDEVPKGQGLGLAGEGEGEGVNQDPGGNRPKKSEVHVTRQAPGADGSGRGEEHGAAPGVQAGGQGT